MDILNFERKYVEEATAIARVNYYDERQFVKSYHKCAIFLT